MFEIHDPHRLVRHEYARDSAGAGRWRGGLGVETEFVIDGENVTGIAFGDGVEEEARAFGLFGGQPGSVNELALTYPDGSVRRPESQGDRSRHPARHGVSPTRRRRRRLRRSA